MKTREKKISIKSLINNYMKDWERSIQSKYCKQGIITFIRGQRLSIALIQRKGDFKKEVFASLNFELDI